MLLSLAAGLVILARLIFFLQGMIAGLTALAGRVEGVAFTSLLRCAGVLLLTDYACAVCKEAEAEALAWCTAFAGRVSHPGSALASAGGGLRNDMETDWLKRVVLAVLLTVLLALMSPMAPGSGEYNPRWTGSFARQ